MGNFDVFRLFDADLEEGFAIFNGIAVFDEDGDYFATTFGGDFVVDLHGLDQTNRFVGTDDVTNLDERWRVGA